MGEEEGGRKMFEMTPADGHCPHHGAGAVRGRAKGGVEIPLQIKPKPPCTGCSLTPAWAGEQSRFGVCL